MGIYTTQVRSYSRVLYIYLSEIIMIMYNRISVFLCTFAHRISKQQRFANLYRDGQCAIKKDINNLYETYKST